MMSSISLQCQLLCASGCTYNIDNSTGTYQPPAGDPFGPAIGWTAGVPQVFVGGLSNQNAALVGTVSLNLPDGPTDSIVIAFQGTLPPAFTITSISDWLTDFCAEPTSASSATENIPGLVHSGILQGTLDISDGINSAVSGLQNAAKPLPVYITGHSKGGGMASIAAALISGGIPASYAPAAVYTFASPMIGNQDFVNGFSAAIPVYRFENYLDIVPFLAPSSSFISTLESQAGFTTFDLDAIILLFKTVGGNGDWGYVPLGQLNFIENGAITTPEANPSANAIAVALAQGSSGLSEVATAHSHLCGAGYMDGTCNGSGVCPVGN